MKYIIYSANIGGYDLFNTPKLYDKNVRYILFTDNKYIKSDIWEINHVDFLNHLDNRKKARYIKTNPKVVLPEHDISLWIDHNFTPNISNFQKFIDENKFLNHELMLYKHRFRNCIYEESVKVLEMKKENYNIVNTQMLKYKNEGFPKNLGLYETGFMLRKNNDKVNLFNNFWWNEIESGSGRDQLSQMYISWKLNISASPFYFGESAYNNQYTITNKHVKEYIIK
jgi:hypothetical protein